MKYPQLVSTRAVNAISDWLVSRLEQLGVEAPLIYSRLLLSLLQSSVQINDPIEFNNLETFLANRKGSKRYPNCDTDTLKKLAAIQCLMDTVSSEQEINNIENLVDELCEKLNDIENQISKEENDIINEQESTTTTAATSSTTASVANNNNKKLTEIEDPRKRYYRAFPALSKEMEDSVKILKCNTKTLTWPVDRKNSSVGGVSSSSSSSLVNNSQANTVLCNTAGVKRKTKRRRNQLLSKGKTANNIRKNSFGGNCSPTWDTDFEGSWEMGRDLIKEFIVKQNNRNRSTSESGAYNMRNCSNNDNCEKRMKSMMMTNATANSDMPPHSENDDHNNSSTSAVPKINITVGLIDTSFCDDVSSTMSDSKIINSTTNNLTTITADEGYSTHENLTSLSEITDGSLGAARRLYERDVSNDSLNSSNITSSEQNDFDQFKAKFNSSVEALWKNESTVVVAAAADAFQTISEEPKSLDYLAHHETKIPGHHIKASVDSDHDYYSMPNYLGNPNKIIGYGCPAGREKTTPIGMFLQDSIWSENSNISYSDSDESFYSKVLISSYNNKQDQKMVNSDYNCNSSKWSEGINGGVSSYENSLINSSSNTSIDSCVSSGCFKRDINENVSKNRAYINEYNNWQQQNTSSDSMYDNVREIPESCSKKITLSNHSTSSSFVDYSRVKPFVKFQPIRDERQTANAAAAAIESMTTASGGEEEENLLTSEKTHFHPIKHSYADGHSFEISSNLDEISYERSASGYFCVDSEKYLEYPVDGCLADDDVSLFPTYSSSSMASMKFTEMIKTFPKNFDFIIKFRIRNTDKGCQTEDLAVKTNDEEEGGYAIKTQGRNINDHHVGGGDDVNMQCDEETNVSAAANMVQWSMAEICKNCVDNNNTHTLWGVCPTCNNDTKSQPANSMLKDELNIEADEIMSDLKYMQDLYIGSDWEDDDDDDDTDLDAETIRDCEYYQSNSSTDGCTSGDLDDDQKDVLYANVTKLITDLLKPENAKSLANALGSAGGGVAGSRIMKCEENNNCSEDKYIGGLWNDENMIWKNEFKPIEILSQLNTNNNNETFRDKITWEYSNLADIWNKSSTTPPPPPQQPQISSSSNPVKNLSPKSDENDIFSRNLKNRMSAKSIISEEKQLHPNRLATFLANSKNIKISNRFDRKRRHSASQNVSSYCNNNNNSADYNNKNHPTTTIPAGNDKAITKLCFNRPFDGNIVFGDGRNTYNLATTKDTHLDYDDDTLTTPATIITCKYWTLSTTATANDISTSSTTITSKHRKPSHFDGAVSPIPLHPSSILKHVTLVSRPLTR